MVQWNQYNQYKPDWTNRYSREISFELSGGGFLDLNEDNFSFDFDDLNPTINNYYESRPYLEYQEEPKFVTFSYVTLSKTSHVAFCQKFEQIEKILIKFEGFTYTKTCLPSNVQFIEKKNTNGFLTEFTICLTGEWLISEDAYVPKDLTVQTFVQGTRIYDNTISGSQGSTYSYQYDDTVPMPVYGDISQQGSFYVDNSYNRFTIKGINITNSSQQLIIQKAAGTGFIFNIPANAEFELTSDFTLLINGSKVFINQYCSNYSTNRQEFYELFDGIGFANVFYTVSVGNNEFNPLTLTTWNQQIFI